MSSDAPDWRARADAWWNHAGAPESTSRHRDLEAGARIAGLERRRDRVDEHRRWFRPIGLAVLAFAILAMATLAVNAVADRHNNTAVLSCVGGMLAVFALLLALAPHATPDVQRYPTPEELAQLVGYIALDDDGPDWHLTVAGQRALAAYRDHTKKADA